MQNSKILQNLKYEFVIIGSGAGGATLGKELAFRGKDVLILFIGGSKDAGRNKVSDHSSTIIADS